MALRFFSASSLLWLTCLNTIVAVASADDLPRPPSLPAVLKVIDFRKLPILKDTHNTPQVTATSLNYSAPSKVPAAFDFYADALGKLGWKVSDQPGGKLVTDEYGQGIFLKQGYQLSLSLFPDAQKPGNVSVMLTNLGNVDTRKLPTPPESQLLYGGLGSTIHVTPVKVPDAAAAVSKSLQAAGWRQYVRPFSQSAETPEHVQLMFFQGACNLSVSVSIAPAQGGKTTVQYATTLLTHELPAPPDATQLEFDTDRPYLACRTSLSLAKLAEFYRKELTALGYNWREANATKGDVSGWYCDDTDKSVLTIALASKEPGTLDVKIERISAELLAEMNKPKSTKPEPAKKTAAEDAIAAKKLPLPKGVGEAEYDAEAKEVRFSSRQTVKALVEFYRKDLTGRGWKEDKDFTITEVNVGSMSLKKGAAEIDLKMLNLGLGGGTDVTVSGDGLSWEPETK